MPASMHSCLCVLASFYCVQSFHIMVCRGRRKHSSASFKMATDMTAEVHRSASEARTVSFIMLTNGVVLIEERSQTRRRSVFVQM